MSCTNYEDLINRYLDNELTNDEKEKLNQHLKTCSSCRMVVEELKSVEALLSGTKELEAPNGFTSKVMDRLPKEKTVSKTRRWFRSHPVLTAAALFIILMSSAIVSEWNTSTNDPISVVANGGNIKIDESRDIVIVPEGEVINGDLIVRNGNVEVQGKVKGDVIVINGKNYLASAGHIAGESEEIHQITEWVWFKIKHTIKKLTD